MSLPKACPEPAEGSRPQRRKTWEATNLYFPTSGKINALGCAASCRTVLVALT